MLQVRGGGPADTALFVSERGAAVPIGAAIKLLPNGTARIAVRSSGPSVLRIDAVEATGGCFARPGATLPALVFGAQTTPVRFSDPGTLILDVSCTNPADTSTALLIHTSNPTHNPTRVPITAP